jgi:hypothetical protein
METYTKDNKMNQKLKQDLVAWLTATDHIAALLSAVADDSLVCRADAMKALAQYEALLDTLTSSMISEYPEILDELVGDMRTANENPQPSEDSNE